MSQDLTNNVIARYVVHHKQLERRMDGSSGGAFGALLETLVKDSYYFCGTIADKDLSVKHIVSNNPDDIVLLSGYQPTESNYSEAFSQMLELLRRGEKVVFCGTSQQCKELKQQTQNSPNLLLIDIIHSPFVCQQMVDKYAQALANQYGSPVESIRYYNREFFDIHSKRITLADGRTVYTERSDSFDEMEISGKYNVDQNLDYPLEQRVGDITLAAYNMPKKVSDSLGYAYLSVNTEKGGNLFEAAKKRLVIVASGEEVEPNRIVVKPCPLSTEPKVHSNRIIRTLKILKSGWFFSKHDLRAFRQFVKFNFFTPSINTDFEKNGIIYVSPSCAFKLVDGYSMELHGPLYVGSRRVKTSRQETRLRMENGAKLIVNEECSFGAGSNVEIYKNATLEVDRLNSNAELTIICGELIKLGSPVNVARNATIRDTSGHLLALPGYKKNKPVIVGNHVWICTESTVMPGVTIGDGAIVGACSYVTKKVPAFTIVQNNPATEVSKIKYFRM